MGAVIFKFLIVYLMGVIGMCGYVFFSPPLPSVVRLQKQLNNVELKKKKKKVSRISNGHRERFEGFQVGSCPIFLSGTN